MTSLVLDLFAGPGGWDEGARQLGIAAVGVEWDDAACRTGKAAGHHRIRADVSQLPTQPMAGKVTGLIASPPCQTFSMAGKGKGRDALPELQGAVEKVWRGLEPVDVCPDDLDVRSVLVLEPVRYARDLRPEWIACEQVPAVLPIWQAFVVILRTAGYSAWCGVLNSADYGVPQTRQRAILIASRVRKVQPPPPTHGKGDQDADLFGDQLAPWVSMASALGWGHADKPSVTLLAGGAANGGAEPYGPREREALRQIVYRNGTQANAAERPATEPAPTVHFGAAMNDVRWVLDRPATTVCADPRIAPPGYRGGKAAMQAGHGSSERAFGPGSVRVSIAEAAVLQSFPADYPWQGSKTRQYEQVGNAVPPTLAAHVLCAVTGTALPSALGAVA